MESAAPAAHLTAIRQTSREPREHPLPPSTRGAVERPAALRTLHTLILSSNVTALRTGCRGGRPKAPRDGTPVVLEQVLQRELDDSRFLHADNPAEIRAR